MVLIRFEVTVKDQKNGTESYWEKFAEWPFPAVKGMDLWGLGYHWACMKAEGVLTTIETGSQEVWVSDYLIRGNIKDEIDMAKHGWSLVDGQ